ncbi:transposase [Paraburkholderia youngii]
MKNRRPYPTDVSDEEWYFAAPYLTLMNKDAPQRRYELREMFNALRWIVRAGAPWRLLPNDFPPWELVYQQTQRWIQAGCFEAMVSDLRSIIRVAQHAAAPLVVFGTRQFKALLAQPQQYLTCAASLRESREYGRYCLPNAQIRVELNPVVFTAYETDGHGRMQFTTSRLELDRFDRTLSQKRQFHL